MYDNGLGVPQDYKESVKLYRLSAEQGHASAQINLGNMYAEGQGVLQNYAWAFCSNQICIQFEKQVGAKPGYESNKKCPQ